MFKTSIGIPACKVVDTNSDLTNPENLSFYPYIWLVAGGVVAVAPLGSIVFLSPSSDSTVGTPKARSEFALSLPSWRAVFPKYEGLGMLAYWVYPIVVSTFLYWIHFFYRIGYDACNVNENWLFKEHKRVGYSDWLVKYGWFVANGTPIELHSSSGQPAGRATCQQGTMEWPQPVS